jgi:CubicO group peptidase (beta-lactamase class C family)
MHSLRRKLMCCYNMEPMNSRVLLSSIVCLLFIAASSCGGDNGQQSATPTTPPSSSTVIDITRPWTTVAPAAVDLDATWLARAQMDAQLIPRFRSLLIVRHGQLAAEYYFGGAQGSTLFDVRSVTKSVVGLLTGIALQSGKLPSLQATVGEYLGAPYVLDDGDRAVTVQQLLTETARYQWDDGVDYNPWVLSTDHIQFLLDRPQTEPEGAFTYDSAAVNLLGFILQTAVAEPLPQYANDVLLKPLGVTSAVWEQLEPNMWNGGAGLQLTAQDMLRIGQLVLQGGQSGDQQLVPRSWIQELVTPQFTWRDTNGSQVGITYGYLWWLAEPPATMAYFAWGYGGQFIYVVPTLDMVVVVTSEWQGAVAEGTDPGQLATSLLTIIVNDVLPAAR